MVDVTVGHTLNCSISFLDQNGNPMLTTPTPDSPPVWAGANPAVETVKPSADGLTAEVDTVAVGTDTVSLTVVVGGQTFTASLAVSVDAVPQVLTSVAINAVVS